jgi:hypothetical protein
MTDNTLDKELTAILAPLGVEMEGATAQGRHRCIALVMGPPVTSFELSYIRLLRIPFQQRASGQSGEQGNAALVDALDLAPAQQARGEQLGLHQQGVRLAPASEPLLRALTRRGVEWCAYPGEGFVLAALPHTDVPAFFQEVGRECRLHERRTRYRQRKRAQAFSQRLYRALWEGEASGLLSRLANRWEAAGWLAGLCWICARGILLWVQQTDTPAVSSLDPHLMAIAGEGRQADHVVAQVGSWLLDGDGVSTLRSLLRRQRRLEGLTRPRLRPYDEQSLSEQGLPRDEEASRQLAACLASALGPFTPAMLGLEMQQPKVQGAAER